MANCQTTCSCNGYPSNTKVGCIPQIGVGLRPWIVNMFNAANTAFYIDLTTPLTATILNGFINNTDPTSRLYPYPEIKDIEDVRDKRVVDPAKDGTEFFVRYGIRKFMGTYFDDYASPELDGIINNLRCNKTLGAYWIDLNGTIWGNVSADGTKLYPIKIDPQSVSSTYVKPTNTTVAKITMEFNYHPTQMDCTLAGLQVSEMDATVGNPLYYDGLYNIFLVPVSANHSTSTIVIKLNDGWGGVLTPEPVTGLTKAAGFNASNALYDVTAAANVAINTVVENPNVPGEYTIVTSGSFAAADDLVFNITKTGYDGTAASKTVIVAS